MSVSRDTGIRTFDRKGDRYEIHLEEWAKILLVLQEWGWTPEQGRTFYLATGIDSSDHDAKSLADAGQRLLDAALENPAIVYPVNASMAKVSEIVDFCSAGGFQICH